MAVVPRGDLKPSLSPHLPQDILLQVGSALGVPKYGPPVDDPKQPCLMDLTPILPQKKGRILDSTGFGLRREGKAKS